MAILYSWVDERLKYTGSVDLEVPSFTKVSKCFGSYGRLLTVWGNTGSKPKPNPETNLKTNAETNPKTNPKANPNTNPDPTPKTTPVPNSEPNPKCKKWSSAMLPPPIWIPSFDFHGLSSEIHTDLTDSMKIKNEVSN